MAKLPVLWVEKETIDLIDTDIRAVVSTSPASESDVEYIPAKRCKTCSRYNPPTKGNPAHGWCHSVRDEIERVPPDGSGFCHNHEEAT